MLSRICLAILLMGVTVSAQHTDANGLVYNKGKYVCDTGSITFNGEPVTNWSINWQARIRNLTITDPDCTWVASSQVPWITITPQSAVAGTASVSIDSNRTQFTRVGRFVIGNQWITVTQSRRGGR